MFLNSFRALCPRGSSFLLAVWSPRLGKRELVCVLLVHLFVCFVRVSFFTTPSSVCYRSFLGGSSGVIFILCDFAVLSLGRFMLSLAVLFVFCCCFFFFFFFFVLFLLFFFFFFCLFFSRISIVITSFGDERDGLCVSHVFVCLFCMR